MDRIGRLTVSRSVLGSQLTTELTILDDGASVLLTGGQLSHVGCVCTADPGHEPRSLDFPGHRERVVSEKWASVLADRLARRVAVVCGIHYDDITPEGLALVLQNLDEMLAQLLERAGADNQTDRTQRSTEEQ